MMRHDNSYARVKNILQDTSFLVKSSFQECVFLLKMDLLMLVVNCVI